MSLGNRRKQFLYYILLTVHLSIFILILSNLMHLCSYL